MTESANAPAKTLDVKGLRCPLPVLKARKQISDVDVGECLLVIATDPASTLDFRHYCNTSGHDLVESEEAGDEFRFLIRRTS